MEFNFYISMVFKCDLENGELPKNFEDIALRFLSIKILLNPSALFKNYTKQNFPCSNVIQSPLFWSIFRSMFS